MTEPKSPDRETRGHVAPGARKEDARPTAVDKPVRRKAVGPSWLGIAWAGFMTVVISPVIVFDILTIVHWRSDRVMACITLPLLAAALWAFWNSALARPPAKGA